MTEQPPVPPAGEPPVQPPAGPPADRRRGTAGEHRETVRVRRAPKFAVFLAAGAVLGIIAALILTFAFGGTGEASPNTGLVYTQGQVFGFLVLICVTVGLGIGGLVALLFDRRSARHTRQVSAEHERFVSPNGHHRDHGKDHRSRD